MTEVELEELSKLKDEIFRSVTKGTQVDKDNADKIFWVYAGYIQANLPKIYWDINLKSFKGDKTILKIIEKYISNLNEAYKVGQGLILYGGFGSGKTSLACIVAKEAIAKSYSVRFISMSKILDMINDSFAGKIERDRLDTIIERTEVLILDDLGKEYLGARQQLAPMISLKLDSLFRERINRNKITIVTTNLDAKAIKETYGDSVWSVLNGSCKPYEVKGLDFRIVKNFKFWEKIDA